MKYVGALLLVNVVLIAAYFAFATTVDSKRIVAFAGVGLAGGLALMLAGRLTGWKNPLLGDMTIAVEQARADANEIAGIKSRVEAQSATIDLIAEQAASTVEQLREIACVNAEAILTDSMAAGFMGGSNLRARLNQNDRVINGLREIGVPEEKIKAVKANWSKGVGVIFHRGIRHVLEDRTQRDHVNMQAGPEFRQALDEFQRLLDFEQWEVPSPDEMEAFVEGKGLMNDTVRELIEDYRHFLETGEIRRRDVFEQL